MLAPNSAVPPSPAAASVPQTPQAPPPRKSRTRRVMGTRIAQKILLGYVLPLAVLLVAGIVLPFLLWSYLGRAMDDYRSRDQFAKQAVALNKQSEDTLKPLRVYLRYHDDESSGDFMAARDEFRYTLREMGDYAEEQADAGNGVGLRDGLRAAGSAYNTWQRTSAMPPYRLLEKRVETGTPLWSEDESKAQAERVARNYEPVRWQLNALVKSANAYRDRQKRNADALDLVRHVTSIVIPFGAALSALLIARVLALGIVRPLEELRRDTEALENGNPNRLLSPPRTVRPDEEPADDEIGDLQRAFKRMARTIRQREAVLRAQNEAVAALNRRVEAVLNSTNDGIMLLDRGGGFSLVNQRFAHLFGLDMDELLDHTFAQAGTLLLARFRNKVLVRRRLQEIIDDPEAVADETFDIMEPLHRTLRIYSAPVRGEGSDGPTSTKTDGELLGRIFVFRDVTRETTVDRMKTEFVSTVSHELRTPLTAIKGYVDLMIGGQTGELNEIQSEFLTMVQESTQRLTALINDMLDISRIESGRIELKQEEVDYLPLVQQTVRMMSREADAKQITMGVQVVGGVENRTFARINGDADRITQVLVNLLSNALKYTHAGGSINIVIEWEENFVTTCVADTGVGLSADDMKRLFQKFFRADNSTTREAGGTGLGLAITKAILEKLNGSVWVESEPNVGSKFWFTLPTAEPLPANSAWGTPAHAPTSPATGGTGKNGFQTGPPLNQCLVLSVDGDVSVLHRMGHELRRRGFVTASAATQGEALRRARDLRPDIITLDPLTSGMDGFGLLHSLQNDPRTQNIPLALFGLRLVAGRAETENAHAFVARANADMQTLSGLIKIAFYEKSAAVADGENIPQSTVMLIAEDGMAETVRRALRDARHDAQVLTAPSPDKADKIMGSLWPDLVVLDVKNAPDGEAGTWLARLKRRKPGAPLPVIVLTNDEITEAENLLIVSPFGAAALPLHQVSDVLTELLVYHRAETSLPVGGVDSSPIFGDNELTSVSDSAVAAV